MSGQTAAIENNPGLTAGPFDYESTTAQPIDKLTISDPVVDFLEKHGHTHTTNHKGELVTYYEALAACPALENLVRAMGEGALALTAAQKPEDIKETNDESEDNEQDELAEDPLAKKSDSKQPEKPKEEIKLFSEEHNRAKPEPVAKAETNQAVQPGLQPAQPQETVRLVQPSVAEILPDLKTEDAPIRTMPAHEAVVQPAATKPENLAGADTAVAAETNHSAEASLAKELPALLSNRATTIVQTSSAQAAERVETTPKPMKQMYELHKFEPVPTPVDRAESTGIHPQITYELSAPIEGVEQTLQAIESTTQELEPEPLGKIDELLAEIVGRVEESRVEPVNDDDQSREMDPSAEITLGETENDARHLELKEQIKDLFTELMDELEIEHTPELVDALAEVAMREELQLAEPKEGLAEQAEVVNEPDPALQPIAERFQALEDDEADKALEMLAGITDKVEQLTEKTNSVAQTTEKQVIAVREEVTTDIKESFIELLDYLEIEYTPELVDELTELAVAGKVEELVAFLDQTEPNSNKDRGTHEVLGQLIAAVCAMKKALLHAYEIGKSTLQLYTRELAAVKAV